MSNTLAPITYTAFRVMFHVPLEQYQPLEHRLIHDDLACQMLPEQLDLLFHLFAFKPLRQGFLNVVWLCSRPCQVSHC